MFCLSVWVLPYKRILLLTDEQSKECFELFKSVGEAIFIASLVSVVFDTIYHKDLIDEPIEKVTILVKDIKSASAKLQTEVVDKFESLLSVLGYEKFRQESLNAYGKATRRIISISDYWTIDPEWWENGDWDASTLTAVLQKSLSLQYKANNEALGLNTDEYNEAHFKSEDYLSRGIPIEIIFAGNVPSLNADGQFGELDFRRFLGIAWRIVIAHNVRADWKKRMGISASDPAPIYVPIRINLTAIPVSISIVDDDVFILHKGNFENVDVYETYGSRIRFPKGEEGKRNADAYVSLYRRYATQTFSAREYVEATLFTSYLMNTELDVDHTLSEENLKKSLKTLGLDNWTQKEWKVLEYLNPETTKTEEAQRKVLEERALGIMLRFCRLHSPK